MDDIRSKRPRRFELGAMQVLLEMDHDLDLIDEGALDLRFRSAFCRIFTTELNDITGRYVDGHRYASAALHCMRFLSNPP